MSQISLDFEKPSEVCLWVQAWSFTVAWNWFSWIETLRSFRTWEPTWRIKFWYRLIWGWYFHNFGPRQGLLDFTLWLAWKFLTGRGEILIQNPFWADMPVSIPEHIHIGIFSRNRSSFYDRNCQILTIEIDLQWPQLSWATKSDLKDSNYQVKLQNCWLTPDNNPANPTSYAIITNECPNQSVTKYERNWPLFDLYFRIWKI